MTGAMSQMTPDAPTTTLTAADRCDRCGAQARVRVVLSSGGELMFCGHHASAYEDSLRPAAAQWVDETSSID